MGIAKHDWPEDDELRGIIERNGSITGAARYLNVSRSSLRDRLDSTGLYASVSKTLAKATKNKAAAAKADPSPESASGVSQNGDVVTVTTQSGQDPKLGDYESLLRERGLDPGDWTVTSVKANKWNAMTSDKATGDNRIVEMHQWVITLRPSPRLVLIQPAVHVPPVKRTRVGPPASEKPELIVVESDHQIPYHDPDLHAASVQMLRDLARKSRLAEHIFLGDTGDYSNISRHDDHPAASATPNECIQGSYNVLREKREAAPNIRVRKLKGNHDWRIEGEQLKRSERMYGIAPAQEWEADDPEQPALHLDRLLHLPKLGIELVEDPRGWQHAEVEIVPGMYGLVGRHGWLTGAKTAEASVKKRGRSIIVGHIHRREHAFIWDPSAGCERQGVVTPTMSLVRDERFPHYTTLDSWLQGCVIVTRWPDRQFAIEHVRWDGKGLRWRDQCWTAA